MTNKLQISPYPPGQLSKGALNIDFSFICIDCKVKFDIRGSGHAKRCPRCKKKYKNKCRRDHYTKHFKKERAKTYNK